MGKIDIIGKYNLDNNSWSSADKNNSQISLAVASYDFIKNNDSDSYSYIIYCYGSRVENHSKDSLNINDNQAYVNKIIDYFKKKKHNIIVKFIMLDKDAPLRKDGMVIANYINNICDDKNCISVNLLGHSKSGVMFFDMIKYIEKKNYNKINLYNMATPYLGTKMASPKFIYNDIKVFIDSHISNKLIATKVYDSLIRLYESISSNSHMDYDIALPNGVLKNNINNYDETLIRGLLNVENIDAIKSINRFHNFITGIDNTTLKRALTSGNFIGMAMCIINDLFMDKVSDGFVPMSSEEVVSKYIDHTNINIKGAHHLLMSDNSYYNEVLYQINKNLNEDLTKKLIKKHF